MSPSTTSCKTLAKLLSQWSGSQIYPLHPFPSIVFFSHYRSQYFVFRVTMAARYKTPTKVETKPGMILWLKRKGAGFDEDAFQRSGLTTIALNHPALIVDILTSEQDYVWICKVRGLFLISGTVPRHVYRCPVPTAKDGLISLFCSTKIQSGC